MRRRQGAKLPTRRRVASESQTNSPAVFTQPSPTRSESLISVSTCSIWRQETESWPRYPRARVHAKPAALVRTETPVLSRGNRLQATNAEGFTASINRIGDLRQASKAKVLEVSGARDITATATAPRSVSLDWAFAPDSQRGKGLIGSSVLPGVPNRIMRPNLCSLRT